MLFVSPSLILETCFSSTSPLRFTVLFLFFSLFPLCSSARCVLRAIFVRYRRAIGRQRSRPAHSFYSPISYAHADRSNSNGKPIWRNANELFSHSVSFGVSFQSPESRCVMLLLLQRVYQCCRCVHVNSFTRFLR